ncbi:MAG TPA: hypothetical protein VKF37_18470 [Chloroflexota bacterium]|nr:hypothetical protein [Chloroflexota bacterium]
MNRLIDLRPLASAAVLALATMGVAPAFAAQAQASSLSRVSPQALAISVVFRGTLVALHRAQRTADLADADGRLFPLRFTSVAQEQRLRVGSRLTVSGDARYHVRLLVRAVRIEGVSTLAQIHGTVARRLGRGAIEMLGVSGAALLIHLGHVRVTRVLHRAGRFVRALASIRPGDRLDTAVMLTGAGAVATGTATVVAPPPRPSPAAPSPMQIEVQGNITAVNAAAGTITVQDEDGPTTVVSVSAAGTYSVGEDVDVVGTPTGPGGSAATVQAQFVTREGSEAPESVRAAATTERPAAIKVKGFITAVNAAAGTITIRDENGPLTVVSLGAAASTYQLGQKVKVLGVPTGAGGSATTVRAQYVTLEDTTAPTASTPVGTHVEVKGFITAMNSAAGTLTIQDEDGPTTVVSVGAAGTYRVGQEVEVSGIVTSAGSHGVTVQAQFIRLKNSGGDG